MLPQRTSLVFSIISKRPLRIIDEGTSNPMKDAFLPFRMCELTGTPEGAKVVEDVSFRSIILQLDDIGAWHYCPTGRLHLHRRARGGTESRHYQEGNGRRKECKETHFYECKEGMT